MVVASITAGERLCSSPIMGPSPSKSPSDVSSSAAASSSSCAADASSDLDDQVNSSPNPNPDLEIQSADSLRNEEYRQLFRLPLEEVILQDFNCALQESILLQGHMYLFVHYICFYSNIFGFETKKIIPFNEITSVKRAKTAGIFPNAIEILAGGKKYFFASFLSRDEAFKLINDGWLQNGNGGNVISEQESMSGISSQENGLIVIERVSSSKQFSELECSDGQDHAPLNESETSVRVENDTTSTSLKQVPDDVEQIVEPVGSTGSSSSTKTLKWIVENFKAPEIPESFARVVETKFLIKVDDFFNLFFSDDAINFVEAFHSRCGDKEFSCSLWSPDEKCGHGRNVSFQHPIKIYFGAKFGSCKEAQKFRVYRNSHLMIETSQEIKDVPYGDYFRVEGIWEVLRDGDETNEGCILRVYVDVAFHKKTFLRERVYGFINQMFHDEEQEIKSMSLLSYKVWKIVQSTLDECREAYALWINMAHELLKEKNLEKQEVECPSARVTQSKVHPEREVETEEALERMRNTSNSMAVNERDGYLVQENFGNASSVSSLFGEYTTKFCSFLRSQSQISLILFVAFCVIFLMQVSIVVLLNRPQTVHVVPPEYYVGSGGGGGVRSAEAVAWLERRMHILKDEMLMVEARIERMRHEYAWLKTQLKDINITRKHK